METTTLTKKRIEEYLGQGKRFDGRKPLDFRKISIETGFINNAEGSARVKIGKTEVIAGVKMNVGEPYPDSEDEGTMMVTTELLPLSSPKYEPGPPRFNAIEIARVVDRGIRESGFIDFKKLCIKKGEKVWTIFIDIYSVNDDGNIIDAASMAAIAALKTARMVKYDEKKEKVLFGEFSNKKLPLNEDIIPINMTFYKVGESIILDPNTVEEGAIDTRVSIALSRYKDKIMINSVQKSEIKEFSIEEINKILDLAEETFKKYGDKIIKMIK